MIKFSAEQFYKIGIKLESLRAISEKIGSAATPSPNDQDLVAKSLTEVKALCDQIELRTSSGVVAKALESPPDFAELAKNLGCIQVVIEEEMKTQLFMRIPQERAKYVQSSSLLFGQQFANSFPSSVEDMSEAGKCFGAGRNTACVFHLMRVMDAGLAAMGKKLGITTRHNWGVTIKAITQEISRRHGANPKLKGWKKAMPFYEDALAQLIVVKNAWRNPTMHPERSYNEETAEGIYSAVRGFMKHLSRKLKE